jgi:hypothetical protein
MRSEQCFEALAQRRVASAFTVQQLRAFCGWLHQGQSEE